MRLAIDSNLMCRAFDAVMRDLRSRTPELSGMKSGNRVLDVCCGTGSQALHYARLNMVAAGVDIDARMIQLAERNRRKYGLTNVSFAVASALDLPFRDDLFDHVSICMSLHEKEGAERDRAVSEMQRVAKGEGTLVFIDYEVPLPRIPSSYVSKFFEYIAGSDHYRCFKDYLAQGGLDALLEKSSLRAETRHRIGPMAIVTARNSREVKRGFGVDWRRDQVPQSGNRHE